MALQVIGSEVVTQLLEKLMAEARVVAPHRREGVKQWAFADVTEPADVCLDYVSTVLPPKKYAFPPKEKLVHYELGDQSGGHPRMEAVIEAEPLVLFGVHPCDIYGLTSLDIAFYDKNVDPNYLARRAQMRVVGVDCEPDEYCFCASMHTASVSEGYDLFLTPLDGGYAVEVATAAGEQMLVGLVTREATAAEMSAVKERLAKKLLQERRINCELHNLPLHFESATESTLWTEHAQRCYSCGTCNLTCPTCYCFNVLEQMNLSLHSGDREREWDGCMLEEFAKVASGENFRGDREERLRHRFYRKYSYLFTKYGRPFCCGCGRCVRQCLVHIDPVSVINDVIAHGAEGGLV
jgi:heterodisulfide reductase subunit C